jgi:hypothetical protein
LRGKNDCAAEEARMSAIPPPTPDPSAEEAQREEARRASEGGGADAVADGVGTALDLVAHGALDLAVTAADAALDAASATVQAGAAVAKVSLEVIGSIVSGVADL